MRFKQICHQEPILRLPHVCRQHTCCAIKTLQCLGLQLVTEVTYVSFFMVMLLMKNHAINQSTQLELGAVEYLWDGGYDFSYHENGVEYYDTEVEDYDYNEEVEYSACLISKFCLNYVIALLSRWKSPSMGRSGVAWQEGQSSCKFQSLPQVPVPVLVIFLKTPIYVYQDLFVQYLRGDEGQRVQHAKRMELERF